MIKTACILTELLGGAALFYLCLITLYCGFFPAFSWFWAIMGLMGTGFGVICGKAEFQDAVWNKILCSAAVLIILAGFVFMTLSVLLLSKAGAAKPGKNREYLIVLGAKVRGTEPSAALSGRIRTAEAYLMENPRTKAVLTGGQGRGEDLSESTCMEMIMKQDGIPAERLYKEERSTTTIENIAYAKQYIPDPDAEIIVVTSDFHVKRGVAIAKEAGYTDVEGLGDRSVPVMRLHYYTRETLSWIKFLIFNRNR